MIIVGKVIEGIPTNGKYVIGNQWLVDDTDELIRFSDISTAKSFLRSNGYSSLTDEEIESTFIFKEDAEHG